MLKRKLCVIWIWYLLYDNARFQRWLARHRRHGWELADVGCIFFRFERGDGTRYRYYMQMMKDDPDTKRGRDYLAGVEELGVTCLGCFWHRAFFRWEDDGRPVEMFSDLAPQALEAKCVRSAQLAAAMWCAVNAALLFFRAWLDLDAARGFDELYADLIAAGAPSIAEAWAPRIAMYAAFGLLWLGLTVWGVRAAVRTHRKWRRLKTNSSFTNRPAGKGDVDERCEKDLVRPGMAARPGTAGAAAVPLREAAPQAAAGAAYRRIKEARLPRAAFLYAIFTG